MLVAHPLSAVISDSPAHGFLWHFRFLTALCEQSIGKHENGFCLMCNSQMRSWPYLLTCSLMPTLCGSIFSLGAYGEIIWKHETSLKKKKKSILCAVSQQSVAWLRYSWHTWVTDLSDKYQGAGVSTVFTLRKMKCGQRYSIHFVSVCRFLALFID